LKAFESIYGSAEKNDGPRHLYVHEKEGNEDI